MGLDDGTIPFAISNPKNLIVTITPSRQRMFIAGILLLAGGLALHSLLLDSQTYDELAHLAAGMSYWRTGDFRLQPEHPPLAKMWAALPLLAINHIWPDQNTPGWLLGEVWPVGQTWLYRFNDAEQLLIPARLMMLPVYLGTCLGVYALARRIFGTPAAIVSLILAAFCPNLAAHGRLVTNDVTLTLCTTTTLLVFARLAERFTWGRLISAALMLAITALSKSSWMLVLPALLAMAALTLLKNRQSAEHQGSTTGPKPHLGLFPRFGPIPNRLLSRLVAIVVCCGMVWLVLWAAYGFRSSPFRGDDASRAMMPRIGDPGKPLPTDMAGAWETMLHDSAGNPRRGAMAGFIRFAKSHRLLPEAVLYGIAHNLKFSESPPGYLLGDHYYNGRWSYFPIALAIKTPLAAQVLLILGIIALLTGTTSVRDPVALIGMITYATVVLAVAMSSSFNIGLRHILPVYPAVFILGGASVVWVTTALGRWALLLLLIWVAATRIWFHPHYLSYFNESIGGPIQGHHYLADSNIDWGQDLKRLAEYAKAHPDETIKLAYFGSADPTYYGFRQMLPSSFPFGETATLTAGTYVISINQLLAVFIPSARDSYWTADRLKEYATLAQFVSSPAPRDASEADQEIRRNAEVQLHGLRVSRLLQQLRHRAPDERVGYSLFVFRLSQDQVNELLRP